MFLNLNTITNVKAQLAAQNWTLQKIFLRAIWQNRGETYARIELDGKDTLIQLHPTQGSFMSQNIIEAVANREYYFIEDILNGAELDGIADAFNAIWPAESKGEVVTLFPALQLVKEEKDDDIGNRGNHPSAESLNKLAGRFK